MVVIKNEVKKARLANSSIVNPTFLAKEVLDCQKDGSPTTIKRISAAIISLDKSPQGLIISPTTSPKQRQKVNLFYFSLSARILLSI